MVDRSVRSRARFSLAVALGAALAGSIGGGAASAEPPAGCWAPSDFALAPGERTPRRATAADRVSVPNAAAPGLPVLPPYAGVVRRVKLPDGVKLVALTFDLCETGGQVAGYDGPIFDALRQANVPATFFAGGKWLETHPTRAKQIAADPLFEIGNHSWDHANLHIDDLGKVRQEILTTETAIADAKTAAVAQCPAATPVSRDRLFRFPYGTCSQAALDSANAVGEIVIQWDVVSGDPANIGAAAIVANVMRQVKPGSIIVMHANGNGKHTREALPLVIAKLRAAGYGFMTVSDLLRAGTPVTAPSCYIEHPGDTAVYDRKAAQKTALHATNASVGAPPSPSQAVAAPQAPPRG